MNNGSKKLCPQCGYKIDDEKILRCPRCNKLLIEFVKCSGSCSSCFLNRNCKEKKIKNKIKENCRTIR